MRTVGIKQLKARLSEYLRAVRAGETLLVTDRDQVVAEISPPRRDRPGRDALSDALEALSETGEVSLPAWGNVGGEWRPEGLGLPRGSAMKVLDDLRSDR